jgi:hypothetical protein
MKIKKYPLETCHTEENGDIIFAAFPENMKVDLAAATEIVANRLDFAMGKKHFLIVDVSNVIKVSPEAKAFLQRHDDGLKNILGTAFIATNPVSVMIANIFVKTKKNFQARFFSKKEDAFEWIIAYRQKVKNKITVDVGYDKS